MAIDAPHMYAAILTSYCQLEAFPGDFSSEKPDSSPDLPVSRMPMIGRRPTAE